MKKILNLMTETVKKEKKIATKTKITVRMPPKISSHPNEDKAYPPLRPSQAFAQPVSTHAALSPAFSTISSGSHKVPLARPPTGRSVEMAVPKVGSESTLTGTPVSKSHNLPPRDADNKETVSGLEEKKVIRGTPASSERIARLEIEDIKEQLHNYLEVCDSISACNWKPQDIIDIIHVFVRSLSFDAVSMAVISTSQRGQFDTLVSRGYKTPPGNNVLSVWQSAITEGSSINWGHLMKIASDTKTDLAYWIVHEGLNSVGYVPIHDNKTIYGFLFVGSLKKKNASPIGSPLLQLCGSRLGLSLALQRSNPAAGGSQAVDTRTVCEIQKQFTLLKDYIKSFRESNNTATGTNEINAFLEKCDKAVSESLQLLGGIITSVPGNAAVTTSSPTGDSRAGGASG